MANISTYQDIDVSFGYHPSTKDILKLYDVAAAKFALRNILLTNTGENPDNPYFGVGVKAMQFEITTPAIIGFTKRKIVEQVGQYLPEIRLVNVSITSSLDTGEIFITIQYYVIGNPQQQTYNLTLERLR